MIYRITGTFFGFVPYDLAFKDQHTPEKIEYN